MKSKDLKRQEAKERQKRYDGLSEEEKLYQIEMRRGDSERETDRILKPESTETLSNDGSFEIIKEQETKAWDRHNKNLQDHQSRQSPDYIQAQKEWDEKKEKK